MAIVKIFDILLVFYSCFFCSLFLTDYSFLSGKGISNIAGPGAGLIFLLSLRFLLDRGSFRNSPAVRSFERIEGNRLLILLILFVFTALSALSVARHFSLSSGSFDLGIFDQAIWNTTQGRPLFSSLKGNINIIGDHFEPILFLLAPLYKVFPSAVTLLVVQALLLASALIPLNLLAGSRLKEKLLVSSFIISYALSRPLRGVGLSDFHPECFILPLLFWAYFFLEKKRNLPLIISVVFLLLCKEDVAFLICALGLFAFIFQRRKLLGAALVSAGIFAWVIETKLIIPHFSAQHVFAYMNRLPFGMTYEENFKAAASDPSLIIRLLCTKDKLEYFLKIFAPLGFLSFFSPAHYILIAVPFFRNLMPLDPNFSGWYNITSHYTAALIPFIYIAAIYGAGRIVDKIKDKRAPVFLALLVMISSLFFYGRTDAGKLSRYLATIRSRATLEKISFLSQVPQEASVAANFNLVPHLSHRKYIFEWNPRNKKSFAAEYLVIDMTLLEYLSKQDLEEIPRYFTKISAIGYKKVFESPGGEFFIYHNKDYDRQEVERKG